MSDLFIKYAFRAWASVLMFAVAMWLGWQAKGEASHE
jgi:hypothetical protein